MFTRMNYSLFICFISIFLFSWKQEKFIRRERTEAVVFLFTPVMCLWMLWVCIHLQVIDSDVMAGEWFEYDMGCMILLCSLLFGVISRFISCWTSLQHTDSQSAPWEMNLANAGLNMQVSAPVMSGWGASEAMLNIWICNVSGLRTMNIWGESRKHVKRWTSTTGVILWLHKS